MKPEELFDYAMTLGHAEALDLARRADSEDKRNFYAFIANTVLQREQKKAIEQGVF